MQFRFSLSDLSVWPFVCLKGRISEPSNPSFHVKCTAEKRKREKRIEHATTTTTLSERFYCTF